MHIILFDYYRGIIHQYCTQTISNAAAGVFINYPHEKTLPSDIVAMFHWSQRASCYGRLCVVECNFKSHELVYSDV